jgi:subtilase-type serine protease
MSGLPASSFLHQIYKLSCMTKSSCMVGLFASLCMAVSATATAQTPESFRTPEFKANWGLSVIRAEYAYSLGYTGAGVKLGIADGAFQLTHPEFVGRIYYPNVFPAFPVPGLPVPNHGTHVMGLAAAARNNVGMMGVAFNAGLAGVIAVDDEKGYPPAGDWAGQLIAAGAPVMNGSFGPDAYPQKSLKDDTDNPYYREINFQATTLNEVNDDLNAVRRLSKADVVMVFAAGNEYKVQPKSARYPSGAAMIPLITPARTALQQPNCNVNSGGLYCFLLEVEGTDPNNPNTWQYEPVSNVGSIDGSAFAGTLIAVVATDQNNVIADFSNRCGDAADWCLAAPGVNLLSSVPMNTYAKLSGTSMASPLVAGSAAVLRQAFPYMTARQVIEVLLTSATNIGDSAIYGRGLLNLGKAVKGPVEFGSPSLIAGNTSIFAPIFAVDTQGYDSIWSNNIGGVGGFSKSGAGMLTLTGTNIYSGDTTVTGGILRVNGSIAQSDLTVGALATLQGTGTVGDALIRGTVSPGNSIGTLTVDGDLLLATGSTYLFEVDADQNSDLLVVTDEARIESGARFELDAEDGVYLNQPYQILKSGTLTGNANGTFTSAQSDYTFIDLGFKASGNDLAMVVERNTTPMSAYALTNNQRAVANAIDAQSSGAEPYNDVLLNDNPSQLPGWFQGWSGEVYSANQAALLYDSRLLAQVVNWRMQDSWLNNNQTTRLQQMGQANRDTTVWAQAYGNWDKFSANANAQKATANSGGFILGLDHAVTPSLRLGGALSASTTSTSVQASAAETNGFHALLYGTFERSALRLNAGVVQSWFDAKVNRSLPLDDLGNARSSVSSNSTQLFLDASTPITLQPSTTVSPFAQVSQTWLQTASFHETGAEARLSGQSANAAVGFGTVGARLQQQWQTKEMSWQASVSAGWQRAWGDLVPTTTLAFATGPNFTVTAAPIARDAAVIEVGIGAQLSDSSRFNLVYSTTLSNQSSSQMLQAQLQWLF